MTALMCLIKVVIWIWRFDSMYRQSMNIVKGVGLGIAAGAAVAAVSSKMMKGKKSTTSV